MIQMKGGTGHTRWGPVKDGKGVEILKLPILPHTSKTGGVKVPGTQWQGGGKKLSRASHMAPPSKLELNPSHMAMTLTMKVNLYHMLPIRH